MIYHAKRRGRDVTLCGRTGPDIFVVDETGYPTCKSCQRGRKKIFVDRLTREYKAWRKEEEQRLLDPIYAMWRFMGRIEPVVLRLLESQQIDAGIQKITAKAHFYMSDPGKKPGR